MLSTFSNILSSETTGPIETKCHVESTYDGETNVYSYGLGHMTNMTAMPIYSKNRQKISFSRTKRPMTLKLQFIASAFLKLQSIYVFSYFPFGFEGRMWGLIVSVPDHCLSFYFGMQHWVVKYYKDYSKDDPGWSWLIWRQGQIWSLMI